MSNNRRKWIYEGVKSDDIIDNILQARGIKDKESFLNPSLDNMHDFSKLEGVPEAVESIKNAINNDKTIVLYHDYDADGIGGGSVAYLMLKEIGAKVDYYSNDRFKQGYGMCKSGIDEIIEKHGKEILIITIDNGISQIEEAKYLKELGINLIVTDHHEPQEELPIAEAIVNPKVSKTYPFKELCGAGVIWKLLSELYPNKLYDTEKYLDIVALSTVADVVPLLDENRIIVSLGLKRINRGDRMAFDILNKITKTKKANSHYTLAYVYGPILNAVGRLEGKVDKAVEAFVTKSPETATKILQEMVEINEDRKEITVKQLELIDEIIDEDNLPHVIVVQDEDLHEGIVGLVAGRIKDRYNRPTIVFSGDDDGLSKGSARGIEGLDMMQALKNSSHLLEGYGGHTIAAGMTIKTKNIEEFTDNINKYAKEVLTEEDFIKEYRYIDTLEPEDITEELVYKLDKLEPYGKDFEKPTFKLINFEATRTFYMGKEKEHLKIQNDDLAIIAWRQAEVFNERVKNLHNITALGFPEINQWRDRKNMQFVVKGDNFY